jgi:hypothetical protein
VAACGLNTASLPPFALTRSGWGTRLVVVIQKITRTMLRNYRYFCLMALFVALPSTVRSQAQTIRVLVLDALNGKPQGAVEIEYFCSGPTGNELPPHSAITNSEGVAEVPYRCTSEAKLQLAAISAGNKEQCGGSLLLGFEEVASAGIVSDPTADGGIWCPKKVSKKLKPVAGQVIIFVKKPTWWQSHIAG